MANIWLIRHKPNQIDKFKTFKEQNIIAIGWNLLGNLEHKNETQIKELISSSYENYLPTKTSHSLSSINAFVNKIKKDDIVVVPKNKKVHFAIVKSEYRFEEKDCSAGFPHQRKVDWFYSCPKKSLYDKGVFFQTSHVVSSLDKYAELFPYKIKKLL